MAKTGLCSMLLLMLLLATLASADRTLLQSACLPAAVCLRLKDIREALIIYLHGSKVHRTEPGMELCLQLP